MQIMIGFWASFCALVNPTCKFVEQNTRIGLVTKWLAMTQHFDSQELEKNDHEQCHDMKLGDELHVV